jgi:pyruvate kinase
MKKTKMVCTIGPASEQKEMLVKLINAGMNVMRMNFSHGDHEEQGFRIRNIKALNEEMGWNVGIALDTKGPEIRTGYLKDDKPVDLVAGNIIRITMDYSYLGDENKVAISYAGLYDDMNVGGTILFEDGNINLTVIEKDEENRELVCRINNNRKLKNKRNCDIPGAILNMPFVTQKEIDDIKFGTEQEVDFVFASFVRRRADIEELRALLAANNNTHMKIIAKIENQEGVDNMDEIIDLCDGVMVARGDLGVNVDPWDMPQLQKEIIAKCQAAGKFVITATQMLDSMIVNPRPTRAEVTDVHNAVLDGTGATMLSGESAQGDWPFEAVDYMAKIDEVAEDYIDYEEMIENAVWGSAEDDTLASVACAAAKMALEYDAQAIVAEGNLDLAMRLSQFRPCIDVFYGVEDRADARILSLAWGIQPVHGHYAEALAVATEKLGLEAGAKVLKVTKDGVSVVVL